MIPDNSCIKNFFKGNAVTIDIVSRGSSRRIWLNWLSCRAWLLSFLMKFIGDDISGLVGKSKIANDARECTHAGQNDEIAPCGQFFIAAIGDSIS